MVDMPLFVVDDGAIGKADTDELPTVLQSGKDTLVSESPKARTT